MQLLLNKDELLNLGKNLRSVRVHCQSGCCWLTLTGDSRDYILRAGQSHTITQRGKVLVTAMTESCLELNSAPSPKPADKKTIETMVFLLLRQA